MTFDQTSSISDLLLRQGAITQDQWRVALQEQARTRAPAHRLLVDLGFITDKVLQQALEAAHGVRSVELESTVPDLDALALLPKAAALRYKALPLAYLPQEKLLRLAVTDPNDILLLDQIRFSTEQDLSIEAWRASERDIFSAIDRHYGHQLSIDHILEELESDRPLSPGNDDGQYGHPVVRLVDALLIDAVKRDASDIHFEPEAGFLRIRYRVDGILHRVHVLHHSHWPAMAVRLKVITGMNIAESRAPQDGRLSMQIGGRPVDFRASAHPTLHGENIVLRILDRHKGSLSLNNLGLGPSQRQLLKAMLGRPEGILLVTGPTGSGKTTTLYALLNEINTESVNIMALEDPVEYPVPLIRQTSLSDGVKLDFASGIRSLMRQDPDVMLVGEIRDAETAEMAFRAAMTGHQVFATLHANSAIGALPRLKDLGVRPAILEGNLIGIVAQRLVRKLCEACKTPHRLTEEDPLGHHDLADAPLYQAAGCPQCQHRGYRGRTAVMELLPFTPELDDLAARNGSLQDIRQTALEQGFRPLAQAGLDLVRQGITSLAELARVVDISQIRLPA